MLVFRFGIFTRFQAPQIRLKAAQITLNLLWYDYHIYAPMRRSGEDTSGPAILLLVYEPPIGMRHKDGRTKESV
jgi:hypothetical protein